MNDKKARSLVNSDSISIENEYFDYYYSGVLVTDGVNWTLVNTDDEDWPCLHLPDFITKDHFAVEYIQLLRSEYNKGIIAGREHFKLEVKKLFKLK